MKKTLDSIKNTSDADFLAAEKFVCDLRNAGSKFALDRIAKLCEEIGNPQNNYPIIHIAGTNGKGSVCAMLERILRNAGMKTGMFTSPHLVNLGERIQVNRKELSRAAITQRIVKLRSVADKNFNFSDSANYPSFFEFMTAIAFDVFSDENVDCVILETGLGGRLDSTNIVRPNVSVITSIGLDHTAILGETIEEIAREKAGIIKQGVPIVCGFLPKEALSIVKSKAEELSAPFYFVGDYFPTKDCLPQTSLQGLHQRQNAALALLVIKALQEHPTNDKTSDKFAAITESDAANALLDVRWAARWQKISLSNGGELILDSSHNPEGAKTLADNLDSLGKKKHIIAVGVLGEERAKAIFDVISKRAKKIILLVPNQPRALDYNALKKCIPQCDVEIEERKVSDIFHPNFECTIVSKGEQIICTGSIYLAGEVLAALSGNSPDGLSDIF